MEIIYWSKTAIKADSKPGLGIRQGAPEVKSSLWPWEKIRLLLIGFLFWEMETVTAFPPGCPEDSVTSHVDD